MPSLSASVLLVEDDPSQARLLRHWLTCNGHHVETVYDGHQAMCSLDSHWDLILSDIQLPGVDGIKLLSESKRRFPERPAILLTAQPGARFASEAIDHGVDAYLLKPVGRDALLNRVEQLIRRARLRRPTILAIGAHPDDVEIGCGGSLLRHHAIGDEIFVLTLSGGEKGGQSTVRQDEAREAARLMGATLILGDLPDTAIPADGTTIALIRDVILRVRPSVIYTHTHHDLHQDHRAVCQATQVAARDVPSVLCYQSPSTNIDFRPGRFIDISAQLDRKLKLLHAYASQVNNRPYLNDDLIASTARYWGRFGGYGFVEPMEIVRDAQPAVESTQMISTVSR
ncbi:MAG: PIG-L family deacetylase [Myxococcota bacterium]